MFPSKDLPTMASKEPDRQAIITQTATFLAMGGEIEVLGTIINTEAHKQLGEVGLKNKKRAHGKKLADARKFHV